MKEKDRPIILDVDKIIANLGRRRSGSIVYLRVDPAGKDRNSLIVQRGKRQEGFLHLCLPELKHKLRQMGYVVVVTPEARRVIKKLDKEWIEWLGRYARSFEDSAREDKRVRTIDPRFRNIVIGGGTAA
ncbi:hypothetical protein DRH29_00015 [candidate division Kazan bacterium]|uniref:Uncharacterized protein n=1 Tax=candidate division Kazan bacterium TaxID=2202143 RepID=A0A420ZDX6_UNCK3|nr:MAG: hypothetical protein DRH29_00015 [candidate division Kazan bacterium]